MACETISSFSSAEKILTSVDKKFDKTDANHRKLIRHLYRRIGFGASLTDIEYADGKTIEELVDELIGDAMTTSLPDEFDWSVRSTLPPIYLLSTDPTNIHMRDITLPGVMYNRMIANYWINECITESIKSKLLLFWHSHFAIRTADYIESYAILQYFKILFNGAFGDFKELVKKIGRTPMMLVFLSGLDSSGEPDGDYTDSSKEPNENYARELLELFTMGIKDKNGVDNYTEDDIEALARALTGWRVHRNGSLIGWGASEAELAGILDESKFHFQYKQHDWGEKTLFKDTPNEVSFNSLTDHWKPIIPDVEPQNQNLPDLTVIAAPRKKDDHVNSTPEEKYVSVGTDEYNGVHDIIFEKKQQEIAYLICKKLYKFYVYDYTENTNLDQQVLSGIDSYISALATTFIGNEDNPTWNIEDVLRQIFKSQHFYDVGIMGTQIKSHIESTVSLFRSTALQPIGDNELGDYKYRLTLLTPDQAGISEEVIDGVTNPNYNGEYFANGTPNMYYNNEGKINIVTGEGAPIEWIKVANQYFHDQQMTWGINRRSSEIGQDLFMPPSVEGWPGHRTWINEYTLVKRQEKLLCVLRDISASATTSPELRVFSALTRDKFRQMAEDLLVLEYGETAIEETDTVYGGPYDTTSQYQSPEKLVRVLWKHFFSVEAEEKNMGGTMIGQIADAMAIYVGTWQTQDYRPRFDIRGCLGFLDSTPPYCAVNSEYKDEVAQRVIDVLEYFVRQPEFNLT